MRLLGEFSTEADFNRSKSRITHQPLRHATLTREISNELGVTVEETLKIVLKYDKIPTEFVEDVRWRFLGDGSFNPKLLKGIKTQKGDGTNSVAFLLKPLNPNSLGKRKN